MPNVIELWMLIRAINNQEPELVAIIRAILYAQFQIYLHKCVCCWGYNEEAEMKPFRFPEMFPSKKNLISLLDIGVSPNFYNRGILPIHTAAENFQHELVQILIERGGANVSLPVKPLTKDEIEQDKKDYSFESYFSSRKWHSINNGSSALHLTVRDCNEVYGHYDVNRHAHSTMKILLDKDSSIINMKNDLGITPWDMVQGSKFMGPIMDDYM
jgi:ankyrin repeat protein